MDHINCLIANLFRTISAKITEYESMVDMLNARYGRGNPHVTIWYNWLDHADKQYALVKTVSKSHNANKASNFPWR